MDKSSLEILRELKISKNPTQRNLAQSCGISLGKTNQLLHTLINQDFVKVENKSYHLTGKAHGLLENYQVDNAIILAAGLGTRFMPLSHDIPKGLLKVFGEPMLERQIKQLLEAGITDITMVVGYRQEEFAYLTGKYGVSQVYNPEYASRNNLSSLYHVRHLLSNTYVLSSDNYLTRNLYHPYEFKSWYCSVYAEGPTTEWCLLADQKGKIKKVEIGGQNQWHMYGPAYFTREFSRKIAPLIEFCYHQPGSEQYFWEEVLKEHIDELEMAINKQAANTVYEFDSIEELRAFDPSYAEGSNNKIMGTIAAVFQIPEDQISGIRLIKAGMTNQSLLFEVAEQPYIYRIPGEGTEAFINRQAEYSTYQAIAPLNITDQMLFLDPASGVKISAFESSARIADVNNDAELKSCMQMLKKIHNSQICVPHSFSIESAIRFYEDLCKARNAIEYEDYYLLCSRIKELLAVLKEMHLPTALAHIDPNCDNFLVLPDGEMKLIDWEYAGMCDPVIDIAMFALYSYFDHLKLENLMNFYFAGGPSDEERLRICLYMALGGFLWALWAEYKQSFGVSFGDYTRRMYDYAHTYYVTSMKLIKDGAIFEQEK